jgi:ketosteroid isomerase-like protein
MSGDNRAVALKFMQAMGTNNPGLADECVAEDGVAIAKGTTKFAGLRNREQMIGGIELFKRMIPTGLRFNIGDVTAEGDRVVVEAEGDAVTADGTPYRNQYCFVFTFQDGKIKRVHEYFCTKLADEVMWPMAERAGGMPAESAD